MTNQDYCISDLQQKIRDAVIAFSTHDKKLLELDVHEQTISHRIAIYLEAQFGKDGSLNVDCEYNKHLNGNKRMDIELLNLYRRKKALEPCPCSACRALIKDESVNTKDRLFRPDIVVHSRGNNDRNTIVVEIKKDKFCHFDGAKLKTLTWPKQFGGKFQYQLGVFIMVCYKNDPWFRWYSEGRSLTKQQIAVGVHS